MKQFLDRLFGIDQATRVSTKFQMSLSWFFAIILMLVTGYGLVVGIITAVNILEVLLVYSSLIAGLTGINTYRIVKENLASIQTKTTTTDEIVDPNKPKEVEEEFSETKQP